MLVRRLAIIAVGLVLASGAVPAGPALAATAPCTYTGCNGKDPAGGCSASNTGTIDSFVWNGVYVEMRLSALCHAVWTRSTYPRCDNNAAGQILTEAFYDLNGTSLAGWQYGRISCNGVQTWTNMLSFSYYVRSCIVYSYPPFKWCTGLH